MKKYYFYYPYICFPNGVKNTWANGWRTLAQTEKDFNFTEAYKLISQNQMCVILNVIKISKKQFEQLSKEGNE